MNNTKAKQQLGMNPATASSRLKKQVLFQLVQQCHRDICFRCGKRIESHQDP